MYYTCSITCTIALVWYDELVVMSVWLKSYQDQ